MEIRLHWKVITGHDRMEPEEEHEFEWASIGFPNPVNVEILK